MVPRSRLTFRLFVSSTFNDLKAERDALQTHVYPRLRELCRARGARFLAVDLRWGVSQEAGRAQNTMQICLNEIERCQQTTLKPNFLVLLGDRYGWRPLPPEIPADEFELIQGQVGDEPDQELLVRWYRRDENAVPPVYILQPRDSEYAVDEHWSQVENRLTVLLRWAVARLDLNQEQRLKYEASATHQEIARGALAIPDAPEHVLCFFREIAGLPEDRSAQAYTDFKDDQPDLDARQCLKTLKNTLREKLGDHVYEYEARWLASGKPSLEHIERLCQDAYASLSGIVLAELDRQDQSVLNAELAAHASFAQERRTFFTGQVSTLAQIESYLAAPARHPLVIYGEGGSGKSSILAQAVSQAETSYPEAVLAYRFIGASEESVSGTALLQGLCKQFAQAYQDDKTPVPEVYKLLLPDFHLRLSQVSSTKPLLIFLDALDQLRMDDDARNLAWLPSALPEGVHIVVSTLPGDLLELLRNKLPQENLIDVPPLSLTDGEDLLDSWLADVKRTLQPDQREDILSRFRARGLPLYLRLAFEEARRWKSYSGLPAGMDEIPGLSPDVDGILRDLFHRLGQESQHGTVLVGRSLGYLAAAKNGLTEDELLDILSADPEVMTDFRRRSPRSPSVDHLPAVVWSRLYFDLKAFLSESSADGTTTLGFFHRQFREAVIGQYLRQSDAQLYHRRLASYFGARTLTPQGEQGPPDLRKLSELPVQQMEGQLWLDLADTLSDCAFMQAKTSAKGIQPLLEDYWQALKLLPPPTELGETYGRSGLELIYGCLRFVAHILGTDPAQLPGQLIARLREDDHPLVRRLLEGAVHQKTFPWLHPQKHNFRRPGGPLLRTLTGHTDKVNAIAITPDGQLGISASADGILKIWDLEKEVERHVLQVDQGQISSLVMMPDGVTILAGDTKGCLHEWNLISGALVRTIPSEQGWWIRGLAITPDGRLALTSAGESAMAVWDLEQGKVVKIYSALGTNATNIAITPDGRRAIAGGVYDYISVIDLENQRLVKELIQGRDSWVSAIAISADGSLALSGDWEGRIKAWDTEQLEPRGELLGHGFWKIRAVAISRDGTKAVSAGEDGYMNVWDISSVRPWERSLIFKYIELSNHRVTAIALTPDGNRAITSGEDHTLKVWDLSSESSPRLSPPAREQYGYDKRPELTLPFRLQTADLLSRSMFDVRETRYQVDKNGDEMEDLYGYSIPSHHRITWHADPPWEVDLEQGSYIQAVLSVSGDRAVFIANDGKNLKVWDLHPAPSLRQDLSLDAKDLAWLGLSADLRRAALHWKAGRLDLWDLETGSELLTLSDLLTGPPAISPNGRWVVAALPDLSLCLWDMFTGQKRLRLEGHRAGILSWLWAENSQRLITISQDRTLKIWEIPDPDVASSWLESRAASELLSMKGPKGVEWSVYENRIAFYLLPSGDLRLWDLSRAFSPKASGKRVRPVKLHRGQTPAVTDGHFALLQNGRMFRLREADSIILEELIDLSEGDYDSRPQACFTGDLPFADQGLEIQPGVTSEIIVRARDEAGNYTWILKGVANSDI